MTRLTAERPRRILIASSHSLFREGLRSLLQERQRADIVFNLASSTALAVAALSAMSPDLVIVDYDDAGVKREEFLAHFIEGEGPMRVILVSLEETGQVTVYDRRTLPVSQIEDLRFLIADLE
ncbi:MAG: hypothetical protein M5U01_12855 [Ardenticatenaceae bacterium]|nr:hypothetical protein [Ardenticatenaceae bacterium]